MTLPHSPAATLARRAAPDPTPGRPPMGDHTLNDLTPRQQRVLALAAMGRTYKQIGDALRISPMTVRAHLHEVRLRLGVKTTTECVVWYVLKTRK